MKIFKHINARSVREAAAILKNNGEKARIIAGGTDLLGQMKDDILPEYPEVIVNIKTIPDLDYIKAEGKTLRIGSLTRLEDIASDGRIQEKYSIVAEACHRTASPHIREMGTIGGNICQSNRCWYYWVPDNRFYCIRKGGKICYALTGDGRYHSIFGGTRVNNTPCSIGCPASVDIPSYIGKIREGDLSEAAKILQNSNPFPSITGRVCPHFCESNCNRGEFDEPVSIRSIERFIGDYILENADEIIQPPKVVIDKSIAIIGSGPAGLSAAYYLRMMGYSVIVFEKMEKAGGLLTYGIPTYRLPKDIVDKQIKILESLGINFELNSNVSRDTNVKLMKRFDAIFLACGAWKERQLGISGEELMMSGLELLQNPALRIRGIPGKRVAVIGGGNVAVDVARTALRLGAEPVIIYRRSKKEMPALQEEVDKAEGEGIKIQILTIPILASRKDGHIILQCVKMRLGTLDKTGRPQPVLIRGSEFTADFDAVINAIGEQPDTSVLPLEFLDKNGHLKIDVSTYSLGKNVFAGGDFTTGSATVVGAIAAGRNAAEAIDLYLGSKSVKSELENGRGISLPEKFNSLFLKKTSRVKIPEIPVSGRINNIDIEDVGDLDFSGVEREANRCFNCSCVAVNSSDIAPVLIVLRAKIRTTKRIIDAEEFFTVAGNNTTILDSGEIVTEIRIPKPSVSAKSSFIKFALRKSIDFPLVNCAAIIKSGNGIVETARICLNAVYNIPYRAAKAEEYITGKQINDSTAEESANTIISDVCPLINNRYKIQIAKTLIKRAILACKF